MTGYCGYKLKTLSIVVSFFLVARQSPVSAQWGYPHCKSPEPIQWRSGSIDAINQGPFHHQLIQLSPITSHIQQSISISISILIPKSHQQIMAVHFATTLKSRLTQYESRTLSARPLYWIHAANDTKPQRSGPSTESFREVYFMCNW